MMAGDRLEKLAAMSQLRKDRAAHHVADCIAAHDFAVERHRAAMTAHEAAQHGEQHAIAEMRGAPGDEQLRIWLAHQITVREQAQARLDYAATDVQDSLDDLGIARRKFIRCSVKHDRIGEMIRKARVKLMRVSDDRNSEEHAEASYIRQRLMPSVISEGYAG